MSLNETLHLALQLAAMLIAAFILGKAAKAAGLPKVAGELAAGILLGPTVAGHFLPAVSQFFQPASENFAHVRNQILQSGLLFFLLAAGMELQPDHLKNKARTIGICSLLGIVLPFLLGWAAVYAFPTLFTSGKNPVRFMAFFMGTALSISALPVIAKILIDLKLMKTRFGTLVMSAAAIDDLVGWILFSSLVISFEGGTVSAEGMLFKALLLSSIAAAALFLEKPVEIFFQSLKPSTNENIVIAAILGLTLLLARAAEIAGVHGVFGAFVTGILFSGVARIWPSLYSKLLFAVSKFFAPLFFVAIGLKFDFLVRFDIRLVMLVFLAACLGKIAGVKIGGHLSGMPKNEAWALAFALNARGAMGIVLAATALKYGMIPENLFAALVIMALGTSLMSGPALRKLVPAGSV